MSWAKDRATGLDKDKERDTVREQVVVRERARGVERDTVMDMESESVRDLERESIRDMERASVRNVERDRVSDMERDRVRDLERDNVRDVERDRVRDVERDRSRDKERDRTRDKDRDIRSDREDLDVVGVPASVLTVEKVLEVFKRISSVNTPTINSKLALPFKKRPLKSSTVFKEQYAEVKNEMRTISGKLGKGAYEKEKERRHSLPFPWPRTSPIEQGMRSLTKYSRDCGWPRRP